MLLGIGAAHADVSLLRSSGIALAAYAVGVTLVARPLQATDRSALWPAGVNRALGVELILLGAFAIIWELSGSPSSWARESMLACAAAAMGVQSETVRALGSFSTTYLTSTLTAVMSGLVRREFAEGLGRSVAIIVAAVASAAAGAGLLHAARRALPALQLAPLLVVVVASRPLIGARRRG